jgi:hypothetical protein
MRLVTLLLSAAAALRAYAAPADDVPSAASFYVPTLPGLQQDPDRPLRMWAGHLLADPDAGTTKATDVLNHLYFVLTKARRSADKERVLFWFNGGPGCSSFDGLMMEIGPWRMNSTGGLRFQEGGWEEYTNVVYGGHRLTIDLNVSSAQTQSISLLVRASPMLARINTSMSLRRRRLNLCSSWTDSTRFSPNS